MTTTLDPELLTTWIGRSETSVDVLDLRPAKLMSTLFENNIEISDKSALAPLWHWLYFPTHAPLSELGEDGHPKLGDFIPPVGLPRRMWAGGRLEFFKNLTIGSEVVRCSTIKDAKFKQGRTGKLCFITVSHDFSIGDTLCVREEHDIVYRDAPTPNVTPSAADLTPQLAPTDAQFSEEICPSSVMLFRYSALTFNGHRIHYDIDYCRSVEGYPALVFHGPLTATLLADLAQRQNPDRRLVKFQFRALAPLFSNSNFNISGRLDGNETKLWSATGQGALAMQAEAEFA